MTVVSTGTGDFELTMDELRAVARFAVESAEEVLPIFVKDHPADSRPRAAINAARAFVDGAPRTKLQRIAAVDAHRAARESIDEAAALAARAAGDAAAAAYLHPLARASQVGHILHAAASAARAAELDAGDDSGVGDQRIEQARLRATRILIDILCRYPPAPDGTSRVARLMKTLDTSLRRP
jgi:hypothetical protein